jgi:F0F1-type ATP synthase gamma subunit
MLITDFSTIAAVSCSIIVLLGRSMASRVPQRSACRADLTNEMQRRTDAAREQFRQEEITNEIIELATGAKPLRESRR